MKILLPVFAVLALSSCKKEVVKPEVTEKMRPKHMGFVVVEKINKDSVFYGAIEIAR